MLITVLSLTSMGCLKDSAYDNGEIQSLRTTGGLIKAIEIKLTANSNTNVEAVAFANSPNDTTITTFPVNLATNDPAPQDIHVTLTQNDQLVTDYNAAQTDTTATPTHPNPSGVVVHDSVPTLFTVVNPGGVVIIPKGQHTGYLSLKFKPSDFLGVSYALGFTITKVAESGYPISGNLQNGIVIINIKNQWDGNYQAAGARVHPALGILPFNYAVQMITTGANTLKGNAEGDLQSDIELSIDANDSVTVGATTAGVSPVFPIAGNPNNYDPVNKVFHLSYYYNTGAPRKIFETLTYNKP